MPRSSSSRKRSSSGLRSRDLNSDDEIESGIQVNKGSLSVQDDDNEEAEFQFTSCVLYDNNAT
jgi:hypothetical protein